MLPPDPAPPHPAFAGEPLPGDGAGADATATGASPPLPVAARRPPPPRYLLAALLFGLTFFSTTTLGAHWAQAIRTDQWSDLVPFLTPGVVARVWGTPALLSLGLQFSIPTLLILLAHELGHYVACRRYRIDSTLPYFLPLPAVFGTLGAFIRIRGPIRGKRELFDVGIAGPLAGFVVLVPFLLYGVAHSHVAPLPHSSGTPPHDLAAGALGAALLVPGDSLALRLARWAFHGPIPAGSVLDLHPFALAAWFGLLATSLNLLPLSQLDGGHILYATLGRQHRRLALLLWLGVALMGFLWTGWWVWCGLVLFLGLAHPPVRDEAEPLDRRRKILAVVALAMLALSLMPNPLSEIFLVDPTAVPVQAVAQGQAAVQGSAEATAPAAAR